MLGKRPRGSPCARWQFAMPPRDVARGGHQGLRPRRGCAVSPGSFSSLLFSAEIGFTDNSVRSLCCLQNGFADAFPVDQNWPRPSPHLCCRMTILTLAKSCAILARFDVRVRQLAVD